MNGEPGGDKIRVDITISVLYVRRNGFCTERVNLTDFSARLQKCIYTPTIGNRLYCSFTPMVLQHCMVNGVVEKIYTTNHGSRKQEYKLPVSAGHIVPHWKYSLLFEE
jgi:hypothetical protein